MYGTPRTFKPLSNLPIVSDCQEWEIDNYIECSSIYGLIYPNIHKVSSRW